MITSFRMSDGMPCTINSLIRGDYERQPEIGYVEVDANVMNVGIQEKPTGARWRK